MSIVGIANSNAAISNPYQTVKKSGSGKEGGFIGILREAQVAEEKNVTGKNFYAEMLEKYKADGDKADVSRTKLEEQALLEQRKQADNGVPYNYLAKDGIIDYNGVIFVCDEKHKALHLGDTSNPKNCLNIPLSGGGSLIVNRDNLGDLAKAIGMFSPEDVNLIMRAIAQDAKVQQMKNQIDDETSGVDLVSETNEADGADSKQ